MRLCVKNKNLPKVIDLTCSYFQNLRLVLDTTQVIYKVSFLFDKLGVMVKCFQSSLAESAT